MPGGVGGAVLKGIPLSRSISFITYAEALEAFMFEIS
jgi:hypothetical protein